MGQPFVLETSSLLIRPFEEADLAAYHQIVDATAESVNYAPADLLFEWYRLGAAVQAMLYQPPYGDRAVILKASNALVGAAGFVPCLDFYALIPELGICGPPNMKTPEVGLFYVIHPDHRRNGYAAEAASALIEYAFQSLNLQRVIATTSYENQSSQAVMRKIGMRICRNPHTEPEWLQIVGVIEK